MAYFYSTSYYPYSTNTILPNPSPFYPSSTIPFYSTNTDHITTPSLNFCFNHGYTPPTPTPSSSPNSYISSLSPQTTPPSSLEMKLSIFDGSEDAYWWIICSEKSFNSRNQIVSDAERLMECAFAMKGSALTWWLSWYHKNSKKSWDSFTCALLWHFKPEWRPILPIEGAEEPTENEEVPEPLEEETAFIVSVQEQVVEEAEKIVDGDSDLFSMTNQNLEISETKHKEEKEQESGTHLDSLSISLCSKLPPPPQFLSTRLLSAPLTPPEPLDLKSPSETVSASATRPPSKPPDAPPVFLIAQPQPLAPLYSSTSPLINSLPRPPETVSSLLSASPPPPKPPNLRTFIEMLVLKSSLKVSYQPPASPPPPKPPDMHSLPYYTPSKFGTIPPVHQKLNMGETNSTNKIMPRVPF